MCTLSPEQFLHVESKLPVTVAAWGGGVGWKVQRIDNLHTGTAQWYAMDIDTPR